MQTIKEDDQVTFAVYDRDNNLLDMTKWKWTRLLAKNPKKFIRMSRIFAAQTKWYNTKYNYIFKVPRNVKNAINFDRENGNTLWQDSAVKEMAHIKDFQTFRPFKRGIKDPSDHTFVPLHMCFDV